MRRFFGTPENAVITQIRIAISGYLLIAIIKKQLHLEASLHTLPQILSVTLFEKLDLAAALTSSADGQPIPIPRQLNMFDF